VGDGDLNRVRASSTRGENKCLSAEVKSWLAVVNHVRHTTQLSALKAQFDAVQLELDARCAPQLEATLNAGEYSLHCAQTDEMLAGFRQVFSFYRDRISQRTSNPTYKLILEAADEIVWSCFRPFFKTPLDRTPPLTFLDSTRATPWAWESNNDLLGDMGASGIPPVLSEATPVPFIGLPYWMTSAPWALVLVAHEVGHHIFRDRGFDGAVSTLIEKTATDAGCKAEKVQEWSGRASEIFADLFSVAAMGTAAIEALAVLIRGPVSTLSHADRKYASPLCRIGMMSKLSELLGHGAVSLDGLSWDRASLDAKIAEAIAVAAHQQQGWFPKPIPNFEAQVKTIPASWTEKRESGRVHGAALFHAWKANDQLDPGPHLKRFIDDAEGGVRSSNAPAGALLLQRIRSLATRQPTPTLDSKGTTP
jgi:hypothetical protein